MHQYDADSCERMKKKVENLEVVAENKLLSSISKIHAEFFF